MGWLHKKCQDECAWAVILAEREGFEPPEVLPSAVFKTAAIDHSAISPDVFLCVFGRTRVQI